MSQHSFSIADESGAAYLADVNNALQALASQSAGATEPATRYAYQSWADTTNDVLKIRNAANSAWIIINTLEGNQVVSRASNVILSTAHYGVAFVATANFTQTLTAAATLGNGWWCDYRIEAGITIVFDPNGAENIDGAATKSVTGPAGGRIYCDGSGFKTAGLDGAPLASPQNSQSAAYTTVLADAAKHILHPVADNNPRTFTIDSNANVAYPVGTSLIFVNEINTLTIAITSDTMTLAVSGATGSRTLAASGIAVAFKIASTKWLISGVGLS